MYIYIATAEFCKDKNGKRPNEEGYDPTTLWIPPQEFNKLTACMK